HALYLAVMTGVLINFILRPFLPTILDLVNTNPQIVQPVLEYMDVRLMASPWVFVSFGLVSFLRGLGDMKTPAIVSIVIILINVPLTYAFVFGFGPIPAMGVKGAAISTIIAQGIECLMYFAVVLNRKNHAKYKTRRLVHPSLSTYKKYLSLSLPVGVAWGLEQTGWLVFGFYIASLSKEAAAANAIVYQFMGFAFMFALAFSIATTTLVGQYLGAKNQEAAKITATHSIRLSVVVLGILGVLFFLLRYPIANAFSSDTDVIQIAANLFIFGVVYQLFDALNIVSAGALRGAGDTRFPMIVMLGIIWCVLIPLVFVFGEVMQWGIYGAWTAASIAIIGMGIVFYIRFRRGKWLNIHIVS
ncbi:MAG: MATE family efflux transporter, partial [Proteobacteria bacterium]|nr:MATE family efflux transporter [Pseudomonadota bacterium]